MPIKFACPKCEKRLTVKDELAGKKGKCKGCGTMITIPQPSRESVAATAPSRAPTPTDDQLKEAEGPTTPSEEDLESVAADLLSDEPAEAQLGDEFEFECPECIEMVTMPVAKAGERHPCPECRRIIRVPEPETGKPKTWREANKGRPSAARNIEFEEKPEGAWEATSTTVSVDSLDEAGALPVEDEPRTLSEKIRLGAYIVVSLAVVGLLGLWGVSWWEARKERIAVEESLAYADQAKGFVPGGLHMLACGYYGKQGDSDSVALADEQFKKAFGALSKSKRANPDRDTMLMELALVYVMLGGEKEQVDAGTAMAWEDVHKGVLAAVGAIGSPTVQREALREVSRQLIAKGQTARVLPIATQAVKNPVTQIETLAVVGIELFKANKKNETNTVAQRVADYYKTEQGKQAPTITQAAAALLELTGQKLPEIKQDSLEKRFEVAGVIEAKARTGKLEQARAFSEGAPSPDIAFTLLLPLAALQAEGVIAGTELVDQALDAASRIPAGSLVDPWDIVRIVEIAGKVGIAEDKVEPVLKKIGNPAMKARAQLLMLRGRLSRENGVVDAGVLGAIEKNSLSYGLASAELARHNVQHDSDWLGIVDDWEQPGKSFGRLGAVQGLQASNE